VIHCGVTPAISQRLSKLNLDGNAVVALTVR